MPLPDPVLLAESVTLNAGWGLPPFGIWVKKGQGQLTVPSQNELPAGKRVRRRAAVQTSRCCPWKPRLQNPIVTMPTAAASASASWSEKLQGQKSMVAGVR